jgi:cellobiose-specific phosphotransferase system component IIB
MTYKLVKLKEVLEQYNEKIDVVDDVEYKQVTVSKT